MVQLQNFFFFITSMVVPRGTAAPVLFQWFVSRDVLTGAPSSNGTIIPIPISSFLFMVYLHSRKFIRSMDRAQSGVLVRASCPILLPDIIGRSSSARNAVFRIVPVLHFLLIESIGDLSYFSSFCGLLSCQFFLSLFSIPRDKSAKRERALPRQRTTINSLATPLAQQEAPCRVTKLLACLSACPVTTDEQLSKTLFVDLPINSLPFNSGSYRFSARYRFSSGSYRGTLVAKQYCRLPARYRFSSGSYRGTLVVPNTNKIQFTQLLPLGPELHMGKERCSLRGLDHLHGPTSHSICGNLIIYKPSPTSDRLMLEHDESLRADLLPRNFHASYDHGKLEHFLHRWMKNHSHQNLWLTMFPEKRYFLSIRKTTSTTEVAIHTNLFTDLYAPIGTGSGRTGGWYTTIIQLPFLFHIRIGFLLASSGGSLRLLRQLKKEKLHWNRDSGPFIIA
uniref:Cytochrome c biogenesis FC n=1 Tax=Musa acuminata TaxID=4641 RepID=A0A8D5TP39_MUSAC|nr:cytochrome c biogenesis FC [Musa acuminata]BCT42725.1 cytochrome c biogenesis FC [Musa acuminata]BCT42803.1 cytochrome c biogenesis FC [Musa acuminata]BCT43350.1 cytochrome c biogenesis FC [Musa acuminata]BCT43388.1 cytochrome c biogenesis FC [Musa acuminata AAA Group]